MRKQMSNTEGIFEKLERIDRRYMYVLVFVLTIYTLLYPIGLPIKTMKTTLGVYNFIENELQAGDYVLYFTNLESSKFPSLHNCKNLMFIESLKSILLDIILWKICKFIS